jgi:hypothetical protein
LVSGLGIVGEKLQDLERAEAIEMRIEMRMSIHHLRGPIRPKGRDELHC